MILQTRINEKEISNTSENIFKKNYNIKIPCLITKKIAMKLTVIFNENTFTKEYLFSIYLVNGEKVANKRRSVSFLYEVKAYGL